MKIQLLWVACFVGLLQLSAVTCRSAHDKITHREIGKFSTTVGPSVAYTGQEIERGVNSSDKLALEPGVVLRDDSYYYREDYFNWPAFILIFFFCIVGLTLLIGCIVACYRCKRTRPGMILNPAVRQPNETQYLQPSSLYNQQQNYQQQNYQQQNYQQQSYQQQNYQQQQNNQQQTYQQQNYQQQNLSAAGELPPPYQSIEHYQPVHHQPPKNQGKQNQISSPAEQSESLQEPSLVEFENPISNVEQHENSPLMKY